MPIKWLLNENGYSMIMKIVYFTIDLLNGYLIGGLEHEFYFSIYWECHHPH